MVLAACLPAGWQRNHLVQFSIFNFCHTEEIYLSDKLIQLSGITVYFDLQYNHIQLVVIIPTLAPLTN